MGLLGQSVLVSCIPECHSMPRFVTQRQSYGLGFGAFADAGKLDTLGGASSVGSAGCVGFPLFSANWPNEISPVVWLQVKSSKQFGDCPTSQVLFTHNCNLEVSGKGHPGEEEGQRTSFSSTKDTCYCQGGSARWECQHQAGGHRDNVSIILLGSCAQGNGKSSRLRTVLWCTTRSQQLEKGICVLPPGWPFAAGGQQ